MMCTPKTAVSVGLCLLLINGQTPSNKTSQKAAFAKSCFCNVSIHFCADVIANESTKSMVFILIFYSGLALHIVQTLF